VYVPALEGNPYGETSLRHLLQMSSGIKFSEEYSGRDDVATLSRLAVGGLGPGGAAVLEPFRKNERHSAPGTKFAYASIETEVLGLVVRQAVGVSLAEYLSERIWQPMGAEADAIWFVVGVGQGAEHPTFRPGPGQRYSRSVPGHDRDRPWCARGTLHGWMKRALDCRTAGDSKEPRTGQSKHEECPAI
jgi:CubicO group peptidase (beta-lactamase class C family)